MQVSELWARNPHSYIRECVEAGATRIVWDRGVLRKYDIDAQRHALGHFPGRDFRILLVGDQGAAELDADHGLLNPKAVYPVWEYGQYELDVLEDLMAHNRAREIAEDMQLDIETMGPIYPADEIPVVGQEHRVVVIRPPALSSGIGQQFLTTLAKMQQSYPSCILHVHGYSTPRWVGAGLRSGDLDLRMMASKGFVLLPNGRQVRLEDADKHLVWMAELGWDPSEMAVPRNRCIYGIQAAQWATENWWKADSYGNTRALPTKDDLAALVNGRKPDVIPIAKVTPQRRGRPAAIGDKFFCEACSLADTCRQFRVGSVCALPDSESIELARKFRSRDSRVIIEGLGELLEQRVLRYAEAADAELRGELDPAVSQEGKNLFNHGVTLAKLLDPKLRSAAVAVQVNAGNGAQINGGGPQLPFQTQVSHAYQALVDEGMPGQMITDDMIQRVLAGGGDSGVIKQIIMEEAHRTALPAGLAAEPDTIELELEDDAED